MSSEHVVAVPAELAKRAHVNEEQYRAMYEQSVRDPETFWAEQAQQFIDWQTPPTQVRSADMAAGNISWFTDGVLNICHNCIDRHLPERAAQTAIIWEGDDPAADKHISYQELHDSVCKLANGLRARGVVVGIGIPSVELADA